MRKNLFIAGLAMVLAFGFGSAQAGIDINEVAAFLVYPGVAAFDFGPGVETFLTITNTSDQAVIAHVSFINGNEFDFRYCYECDFDVPLSGLDTETLVLVRSAGVTQILNLDTGGMRACSQQLGFVTVNVEDFNHNVLTDNILLGEEVVVDYLSGAAFSVEAIPIQGEVAKDPLNRVFDFDGIEYRKFPSVVGADFLAPNINGSVDAALILFTLGFQRQFPPLTDCSIIGFDAFEEQFSNSFVFGCWTVRNLIDIDPEFAYPYLGIAFDFQEHGWLSLACTVYGTGTTGVADGGVHGAIWQGAAPGAQLRYASNGPFLNGFADWSRLLYQSGTVGDAVALHLESPVRGGGYGN